MRCTKSPPIVSVIMGVYNIASLTIFNRAVCSILGQTVTDFEFLICDDGSSDQTWDILTNLAQKDSRINLIRNLKNEGLASALNRCIAQSHGLFIARQDADDFSVPERFQKQIDFFTYRPEISFVGSNAELFDQNGVWRKRVFPEYPQAKDFLFTLPFIHGSLMFRSEILKKEKGYLVTKKTRRTEDYELLMRLYAHGYYGANLQETLYFFLEDREAIRRRKYHYRIDEAWTKWKGFNALNLMPKGIPYVIKPLIVGIIPPRLLKKLKEKRMF